MHGLNKKTKMKQDLSICIDAKRLQQVVLNIYTNALKHVEKGGYIKIKAKLIRQIDELSHPSSFAKYF